MMNPEFMADLVINLFILCALQKWLDSLPEYEDDAEIARIYEEERRRRRARRKARRKGMMK